VSEEGDDAEEGAATDDIKNHQDDEPIRLFGALFLLLEYDGEYRVQEKCGYLP